MPEPVVQEVGRKTVARWCLCPLAGRSRRPSRPPLTACPLRFRPPGYACVQSPLAETATPSLTNRRQDAQAGGAGREQEDSRSLVTGPTRWTFPSAIQASAHCLSAPLSPSGLRLRPEPARGNSHLLAHQPAAGRRQSALAGEGPPRKGRHDAGTFREASRRQSAPAERHKPWLCGVLPQGKSGRMPELSV
jgi:hypothetical protein